MNQDNNFYSQQLQNQNASLKEAPKKTFKKGFLIAGILILFATAFANTFVTYKTMMLEANAFGGQRKFFNSGYMVGVFLSPFFWTAIVTAIFSIFKRFRNKRSLSFVIFITSVVMTLSILGNLVLYLALVF